MSLLFFPTREIVLSIGPLVIRWYGIMYVVGLLLAWRLLPALGRLAGVERNREEWTELLTWAAAGMLLGGRLGYAFFYEPMFYWQHPLDIFRLWQGGMSAHGGFLGLALALWLGSRFLHMNFLRAADAAAGPAALGLALGRIGNFINQELYGTLTALPWGVKMEGAAGLRHPVQIYEAAADMLIAAVCWAYLRKVKAKKPGRTAALMVMLYGLARFATELMRQPEWTLWLNLTRGQWLTIPLFLAGAAAWLKAGRE